ncbi:MAG: hypothetical protein AAFN91_06210 [Pseudomonadota bacterium]
MQLSATSSMVLAITGLALIGCEGANREVENQLMSIEFEFDNELRLDRTSLEPVWIWNRMEEFGDYSVQIPVGEHPLIEKSSSALIARGFQGGGYSWEAMVRASIASSGTNPDLGIDWDSESATMVTYMSDLGIALMVAQHAQKILTDEKHRDEMIIAAEDME